MEDIKGIKEEVKEDVKQDIVKPKKKFSFKEYLETHPEYKERHKEHVSAKVECSCGRTVSRGNLAKHWKTIAHTSAVKVAKVRAEHDTKILKRNDRVADDLKMERILQEIESIKKLLTDHNKEV